MGGGAFLLWNVPQLWNAPLRPPEPLRAHPAPLPFRRPGAPSRARLAALARPPAPALARRGWRWSGEAGLGDGLEEHKARWLFPELFAVG